MQKPSTNHHYVTRAQLRNFSVEADRKTVYVFNKETGKSFISSIEKSGSENHFNTLIDDEHKFNFEGMFNTVDATSAALITNILDKCSLDWLTPTDRLALADLVAVQFLRTKLARSTPHEIAAHLRESLRSLGINPDQDPTLALPGENDAKIGTIRAFLDRETERTAALKLYPGLAEPNGSERFIISDHPVIIDNAFPYGENALEAHGVLVHLPLSPTLLLTLHCPTNIAKLQQITSGQQHENLVRYRDALIARKPVKFDDGQVDAANKQQIAQAMQFLYSHQDAFDTARDMLAKNPKLRSVKSLVHMGRMGEGPPARPAMPPGLQLVVHGKLDHCIVAIDEVDEAGEGITASTRNIALIRQVAQDRELSLVELYEDGDQRRSIREVTIELIGDADPAWFRVVHHDCALRKLSKLTGG